MYSVSMCNDSVLNTFKTMIIEQYVLDQEDMYILKRMMDFISQEDVVDMPAAKALKSLIERAVGILHFTLTITLILTFTAKYRRHWRQVIHHHESNSRSHAYHRKGW